MIIIVKLIGFLIMIFGFCIFSVPSLTKKIFELCLKGNNLYVAGVVRGAIGLILFFAASQSLVPLAAIALGLMFLVSGIIVFASDEEKLKAFIASYSELPSLLIRLFGLIAASFGILVFAIF